MYFGKFVVFLFTLSGVCSQGNDKNSETTRICGSPKRTTGYIVYGNNFKRGDFPWIVALMHTQTSPPTFICGGTLVSSVHVITAAHCIQPKYGEGPFAQLFPKDVLALLGAYNLSNPNESGRTTLSPEEIKVHNDWNPNVERYDADIAVLKFEADEIPLSKFIRPVCLWEFPADPIETDGIVAGWGKSEDETKFSEEIPKQLKLPIHSSEHCFLETAELAKIASKRTFCAGYNNGTGVCFGDSGNGFFIQSGGIFYLKGIVSASKTTATSCDVTNYAIYTNVLKFKGWIDEIFNVEPVVVQKVIALIEFDNVKCTIQNSHWNFLDRNLKKCGIFNQSIKSDSVIVDFPVDMTVQGFSIHQNRAVQFIPNNISKNFPQLTAIAVSYCGLASLNDNSFKDLRNLKYLFLDENLIENISDDAFKDLVRLEQLTLTYNQLQTLKISVFKTLKNLKELSMTGNKIRSFNSNTFDSMVKLETLNLASNQINTLEGNVFEKLMNLKKLSLDENQLTKIQQNLFRRNTKLEQVSLTRNQLMVIPAMAFDNLEALQLVDLQFNDCIDMQFKRFFFAEMKNQLEQKCNPAQ